MHSADVPHVHVRPVEQGEEFPLRSGQPRSRVNPEPPYDVATVRDETRGAPVAGTGGTWQDADVPHSAGLVVCHGAVTARGSGFEPRAHARHRDGCKPFGNGGVPEPKTARH
jgi:hypothetical protein